ncbi:MAG: DUF2017 domain-containing protein [Candidatus Nanopelagicales bacterium]|nr:DUF2017 domain-containing protein [Candidatus Nanopelagicales bacterium]MCF8539010.1 DUF2017 domain-containing protein [Candidatus Nanopelagicales bacterium]MCF8551012.1 DUF2017 domain-containing protein [Candidatus Nanopelagicales bacterium]
MEIDYSDHHLRVSMEDIEVRILQDLASQLLDLTTPDSASDSRDPLAQLVGIDPNATKPTDPVLNRLYPDAYPEDHEASLEFRRFTERSLRDASTERAARLVELISHDSPWTLTTAQWRDFVGFLNDLRLALGTRLEISDSLEVQEIEENDPNAPLFDLYGWLTWMQETFIGKGYFHED